MRKLNNFFKKIQSSGLVLIDQGLVSGTNFLTGILLTRFLGLNEYGHFVLLWMVVLFGLSVTQALITKPLQSLEPKMEADASKKYLGALHGLQLLSSLLICFLTIIGMTLLSQVEIFSNLDFNIILGLSISTALILAYDFYRKYFFLKNDLIAPLITDGILAVVQIGGIFLLYSFSLLNLSNVFLLVAFTYLIVCIIGYLKTITPTFKTQPLVKVLSRHYDFSKWLLGTVAAQWLCGNFFIICAGGILGTAAVGAVRIAQNVIGLTHVIFLAMENIVPINAAKAYKEGGKKKLYDFLRTISIQIGWVVMAILIFISIFSPNILGLLYGAEYSAQSYILICFCIIYLLVYIGYPLRFALRTLEMTRPIFIAYLIGALFSVLSASLMITNWGIYGVLAGLFITQLITQLVYIISLWKTKKYYENHSLGTR